MIRLIRISLKLIAIIVLLFSLYYGYTLVQIVGIEGAIEKWAPLSLGVIIIAMTGSCTYVQQDKPKLLNNCGAVILSILTMVITYTLWSMSLQFFNEKNDCIEIQKKQPIMSMLLDRNMEELYFKGLQTLCSDECPCKVENSTMKEFMQTNSNKMNKTLHFSDEGAINVAECPQEIFGQQNYTDLHFQAMIQASQYEMMFNTSGYCYIFDRYLFSDINRGIPKYNLFSVQRVLMRSESTYFLISFMVLFVVMVCNNFCLCCLNVAHVKSQKELKEKLQTKVKGMDTDIQKAKEFLKKQKEQENKEKNQVKQKGKKEINLKETKSGKQKAD